jgi:phasin
MTKEAKAAEVVAMTVEGISDQVRDFAEQGVAQSKNLYESMKSNAEDSQKAVEKTLEAMRDASGSLSLKALGAVRTHTDAGFAHMEALFGAKTMAQLIELQSSFVRKQFDLATKQAKELQTESTKAFEKIVEPAKSVISKASKTKVAA